MDLRVYFALWMVLWNRQSCTSQVPEPPYDKQFIIVDANATWNDAKRFCHLEHEGILLQLDTKDKLDLLRNLDRNPPWNSLLENGEYWIGLHNREIENCSDVHHFWDGGCAPLGWSKWGRGSPANCVDHRCVFMRNLRWFTANCSDIHSFVCEKEIQCDYIEQGNITLEDVRVTKMVDSHVTPLFTCEELCYGLAMDDNEGCSAYRDSDTCLFLFVDSGNQEYTIDDSYKGTPYHFKNCSQASIDQMTTGGTCENDLPDTECATLIGDDYFEYLDAYRVALIPSQYKTIDMLGDIVRCRYVCLKTEINNKKCWAFNMFSVLSNFCRLYYLHGEPPHLFYQRYVSTSPGPLLLRRRLNRREIQDDEIVDHIEELIVDPKNTTLYNLMFISVYENKPGKIGMGVLAAIFIATVITAIVIVDCPLLRKHVRMIGARNIRKRTICKNKKTTKVTEKRSSNKVGQDTSV